MCNVQQNIHVFTPSTMSKSNAKHNNETLDFLVVALDILPKMLQ